MASQFSKGDELIAHGNNKTFKVTKVEKGTVTLKEQRPKEDGEEIVLTEHQLEDAESFDPRDD